MAEKIVQTAGRDVLGTFAPEFAHYNDDVLFGENWNNQDIDVKTRCMLTVTAIMAQGLVGDALKHHIMNAKNHGVTQKEMAALRHRRKADRAENRKKLEERNEALRNMINRK